MSLDELLHAVYSGPRGPEIGAFFDYDGTVISGYSASAFYGHRLRGGEIGLPELAQTLWAGARGVGTPDDFTALLDLSLRSWAGKPEAELAALGEQLFKRSIAGRLHLEVWELVQAHHDMGHTVVLASSATRFQVEPMARAIDARHVLCTRLEAEGGVLTGRVEGRPLWGVEKAAAVRALAEAEGIDLARSYAYSNGAEDVPFLATAGHATAVQPEPPLLAEARDRGWRVLECVSRGGTPNVGDVARTVGFYGAFGAAFGAGIGLGLLNRSRQQVVDLTTGVGSDLGLALAGVKVEVVSGAEHLWSHRPCVFVFNHQSKIDPVIVMKLLRGGWTGVAKKEARNIPGFGQLFQLAGVAFVDRGNIDQAREVLAPAVEKLRSEGVSLAMSPEGTRSPTPRLGPFKKGAFHIAMQAGVPMVPVVLRGAGDVMWRGAQTIRPGVIEVVVCPPVRTDDWSVATIDRHVAEVRDIFVDTLARWPGRPAPLQTEEQLS
jgi:putative phosphoserine phosphatase/1-acylglycerol-3-phosphate O-acyltransferase